MTAPVLDLEGVVKTFPGVRALDGVALPLVKGEIHALVGENGAGKSTLIKILTGVHRPDAGTLRLDGQEIAFHTPREAIAAGIGAVHQERNLISRFSVGENILLERLPHHGGLVDYRAVHAEARQWLDILDLPIDPRTPVRELSVAQMQLVEIAKALSLRSRILLMDEPTASITPHETDVLFGHLKRLRDEGVTIVFVSHKLEEVFTLCDRITVLRDGRNACVAEPASGMDRARLVNLMIGRDEVVGDLGHRPEPADVALTLNGVGTSLGHRGIDLEVRHGEIHGLYGLVGSGRSELAKALIGVARVTEGSVSVGGRSVTIGSVADALHCYRIGYISEDRKAEGLILMHSVVRNVAASIWTRLAGALGFVTEGRERAAVAPLARELDIRTPSLGQIVGNLSGGNQQKVSVAKWLAANVDILVVDEPTVGIDIRTKRYLHGLIWRLAAEGKAILLITSDMPEMIELADRITVMNGFRIIGVLENDRSYDAMSDRIMHLIQAVDDQTTDPPNTAASTPPTPATA